jgi:hypothetical protein
VHQTAGITAFGPNKWSNMIESIDVYFVGIVELVEA